MLFKLCNAPGIFQDYINKFLQEYLDMFCIAYLDNRLIYSTKEKNYIGHVLQVLKQLHKQGLQINIDKCKFSMTKVKYLAMIVITNNIKIDTEKTKAIQCWETLVSVKEM